MNSLMDMLRHAHTLDILTITFFVLYTARIFKGVNFVGVHLNVLLAGIIVLIFVHFVTHNWTFEFSHDVRILAATFPMTFGWSIFFNDLYFALTQSIKLTFVVLMAVDYTRYGPRRAILAADTIILTIFGFAAGSLLWGSPNIGYQFIDQLWNPHNYNIPWIFLTEACLLYAFLGCYRRVKFLFPTLIGLMLLNWRLPLSSIGLTLFTLILMWAEQMPKVANVFFKFVFYILTVCFAVFLFINLFGVEFQGMGPQYWSEALREIDQVLSNRVRYLFNSLQYSSSSELKIFDVKPFDSIFWELAYVAGPFLAIPFLHAIYSSTLHETVISKNLHYLALMMCFGLVEGFILKVTPSSFVVVACVLPFFLNQRRRV